VPTTFDHTQSVLCSEFTGFQRFNAGSSRAGIPAFAPDAHSRFAARQIVLHWPDRMAGQIERSQPATVKENGERMKPRIISRRRFLLTSLFAAPCAIGADARWIEPDWVKTRTLKLCAGKPEHRFVHFTDLHHKGDRPHTESVVNSINSLSPDFVCFTGDLIEDKKFLPEALEILSGIKVPLYGVPGNHDYWSHAPFSDIAKCFAGTGGAWLPDDHRLIAGGKINMMGASCLGRVQRPLPINPDTKNILLMHYPAWAKKVPGQKFDLLLAGHSHGGQVRIPFVGALKVPYGVEEYDLGLFHTPAGPLYVNPGIGWFPLPVRFNCRPELTLIEI
jgi:predicted MPP superfamily phosphohydrolase